MDTPVLANHQKTYIHQLSADTGCRLEDLTIGMDDKRQSRESTILAHDDDEISIIKKIVLNH